MFKDCITEIVEVQAQQNDAALSDKVDKDP